MSGYISDKIDARIIAVSASVLGAVGWLASAYATGVLVLIVTYGVLVGNVNQNYRLLFETKT